MQREYPSYRYHLTRKEVVVRSAAEDAALGLGWSDLPGAFDSYRIPKPSNGPQSCLQWVDAWPVPDLSPKDRMRIKAHLLAEDAAFCKSPDDPSTVPECMRRAFTGVAEVLFEAGLLNEHLLENEIPQLVWDASAAGGWCRFASELHPGISSTRIGHYWVWGDEERTLHNFFRGGIAEWLSRLLSEPLKTARAAALDTDRINRWIREEGYDNPGLATKLGVRPRVVSSMRNNGPYHGRPAVDKLAKLMGVDPLDLYLDAK